MGHTRTASRPGRLNARVMAERRCRPASAALRDPPWQGRILVYPKSVSHGARETPVTRSWRGRSRPRGLYRLIRVAAIGCLAALALSACAGRPSKPAKPSRPPPEQPAAAQQAQKEKQAQQAAADREAQAKQAQQEARRRQEEENEKLPPEFGTPSVIAGQGEQAAQPGGAPSGEEAAPAAPNVQTVAPVYVPQKLPPPNVQGTTPYDQAFPPIPDRVVRVGIVSGTSQAASARDVARMLSTEDRKYLEDTLGLGVRIAYVSETDRLQTGRTRVYYRPQFFKAAVQIAALLPQSQQVIAMSDADALRHGVDVLVEVGTDLQ